jgi:tripartite-type tricarboxylate transporter receptor subunit TctC
MATLAARLVVAALLIQVCPLASADCPEPKCFYKPMKIVVPFAAGGSVDRVARELAPALSKAFAQPVVVENKAGAGGAIGMESVAKSPPDSHTILLSNQGPISITPHVFSRIPVDPSRDLVPAVQVATSPLVIVVRVEAPFRSLKELTAYAAQKQGGASFGSAGNGSLGHLFGTDFAKSSGSKLTHIPYKGTGSAMIDLAGGQLDAVVTDLASIDLKSGKLRVLAATGRQRSKSAPDVPTFSELGYNNLESGWIGAFFPAKTDPEIVSRLNTEMRKILREEEFKGKLRAAGFDAGTLDTAAFASLVRSDSNKWALVVKQLGIKAD